MKTVLYVMGTKSYQNRQKFAGAAEAAHELQWNLQSVETPHSASEIRLLRNLWHPDGIIANLWSGTDARLAAFGENVPILWFQEAQPGVHCIYCDSRKIAQYAAHELLSLNLRSYACVPWPVATSWSDLRREAFISTLALHGCRPDVLDFGRIGVSPTKTTRRIADWLTGLPKPVGIFAVNDIMAERTVAACRIARLSVPDDVAVIGVDNDTETCEASSPTISSIAFDFFAAGRLAVQALKRLMTKRPAKALAISYPSTGVVRRESTRRLPLHDTDVSAALERIRREACNGLTAAEVLAGFGCSRRLAEMRFRQAVGQSVLQEIRAVRLAKAKDLILKRRHKLEYVAHLSGYKTLAAFSVFFRAETGVAPSLWKPDRE